VKSPVDASNELLYVPETEDGWYQSTAILVILCPSLFGVHIAILPLPPPLWCPHITINVTRPGVASVS